MCMIGKKTRDEYENSISRCCNQPKANTEEFSGLCRIFGGFYVFEFLEVKKGDFLGGIRRSGLFKTSYFLMGVG